MSASSSRSTAPCVRSEWGRLRRVMLARPQASVDDVGHCRYFGYRKPMDVAAARDEIEGLADFFQSAGVEVLFLDEFLHGEDLRLAKTLPNVLFARDTAGVFGRRILVGAGPSSIRFPEFSLVGSVLRKIYGPETVVLPPQDDLDMSAEFGDWLCVSCDCVLVNTGHRTSLSYVKQVSRVLFSQGFSRIGTIRLPRTLDYLHLDLVCNIVAGRRTFLVDPLLPRLTVYEISRDGVRHVPFPEWAEDQNLSLRVLPAHAQAGGANFVSIGENHVLVARGHDELRALLQDMDVEVDCVPIAEVFAGAGGIRCATLVLEREDALLTACC